MRVHHLCCAHANNGNKNNRMHIIANNQNNEHGITSCKHLTAINSAGNNHIIGAQVNPSHCDRCMKQLALKCAD